MKALKGQIDAVYHLAAVYDLSADAESQIQVNVEGTRNVVEFAKAIDAGHLHHVSSIAAAGLYEGVFREDMFERGRGPGPPLLHDQAREREDRAQGVQGAVDGVPPGRRGRRQPDRRDGQDRRPVLLLQADPAHAADPAAVVPVDRPRGRAHQHRAGGLRGRRARPHQPPQARHQRQVLPPGRPDGLPRRRRARHLQQGRARAEDERVRQCGAAGLHPEEREEGPDGAGPGAPRARRGDQGPGPARRHAAVRELPDALRPPRNRRRAQGQRHRMPEPARLRLAAVGLLGTPPRPRPLHRPQPQGHRRRQGGAGDRRLVGHRAGGGHQVRRGRRHDHHLRARRGQAGRCGEGDQGRRRQGRAGLQLQRRHRRRGRLRGLRPDAGGASMAASTSWSTTPAARSGAPSRAATTASTTSSARWT